MLHYLFQWMNATLFIPVCRQYRFHLSHTKWLGNVSFPLFLFSSWYHLRSEDHPVFHMTIVLLSSNMTLQRKILFCLFMGWVGKERKLTEDARNKTCWNTSWYFYSALVMCINIWQVTTLMGTEKSKYLSNLPKMTWTSSSVSQKRKGLLSGCRPSFHAECGNMVYVKNVFLLTYNQIQSWLHFRWRNTVVAGKCRSTSATFKMKCNLYMQDAAVRPV